MTTNRPEILSFISGLVLGIGIGFFINTYALQDHHNNHPIADPFDSEYHVHADFHIVVRDTTVNLDEDRFQTTSQQTLHKDAHLHDNNGDVKHIHGEGITFADFLGALQVKLTDSCLTLDNEYCSGENEEVLLFVNDELYTSPLTQFVPVDDDRILLYYGNYNMETIQPYLDTVPNDACYYSGTCPERGVAPPESCGGTCEL